MIKGLGKFGLAVLILLIFLPGGANAHIPPGGFLNLTVDGSNLSGTWDLSLYSLAETAGLKDKSDQELQNFALDKLDIDADGDTCKLRIKGKTVLPPYPSTIPRPLHVVGTCPHPINKLTISYFSLFVIDPAYHGLVNITAQGETYTSALSTQNPSVTFKLGTPDRWKQFKDYLREGVWHIWLGYDHILFLISLLLSAPFVLRGGQWEPQHGFGGTFWQVMKIVTSFTIAHSMTLGLVIFGIVSLPSRLVESTIAFSIAVAAVNNLKPTVQERLWLLTFCFGLIHGMGFAGALKELGLPDNAKWIALVGFNLGVELGQLTIVSVVLPFIYAARNSSVYRNVIFPAISAIVITLAMLWFTQRAFAITIFQGYLGS